MFFFSHESGFIFTAYRLFIMRSLVTEVDGLKYGFPTVTPPAAVTLSYVQCQGVLQSGSVNPLVICGVWVLNVEEFLTQHVRGARHMMIRQNACVELNFQSIFGRCEFRTDSDACMIAHLDVVHSRIHTTAWMVEQDSEWIIDFDFIILHTFGWELTFAWLFFRTTY